MDRIDLPLLTVREMAARLKVHNSWLYARTRQKGSDPIPVVRCGKYIRFDLPAVMSWLKKQQKGR